MLLNSARLLVRTPHAGGLSTNATSNDHQYNHQTRNDEAYRPNWEFYQPNSAMRWIKERLQKEVVDEIIDDVTSSAFDTHEAQQDRLTKMGLASGCSILGTVKYLSRQMMNMRSSAEGSLPIIQEDIQSEPLDTLSIIENSVTESYADDRDEITRTESYDLEGAPYGFFDRAFEGLLNRMADAHSRQGISLMPEIDDLPYYRLFQGEVVVGVDSDLSNRFIEGNDETFDSNSATEEFVSRALGGLLNRMLDTYSREGISLMPEIDDLPYYRLSQGEVVVGIDSGINNRVMESDVAPLTFSTESTQISKTIDNTENHPPVETTRDYWFTP